MEAIEILRQGILNSDLSAQDQDKYLRELQKVEFLDVDYTGFTPLEVLKAGFIWNNTKNPEQWIELLGKL